MLITNVLLRQNYFHKSGAKIQTFYKIAMVFSANFQRIIQLKIYLIKTLI